MVANARDRDTLLPTICSSYQPLEDYVEALERAGVETNGAVIAPVDAFAFAMLTHLFPRRPQLVDHAGSITRGMSSVLCCTQAEHTTQVRAPVESRGEDWEVVFERFAVERSERAVQRSVPVDEDEALDQVKRQPTGTTVIFAATKENLQTVRQPIARWAEAGAHVMVAVFGLGKAGSCPLLTWILSKYTCGAAQRFSLVRELGPAFHGSGLGLIYTPGRFGIESILSRMKCFGSGNFDYLTLVRNACTTAIAATAADQTSLWSRPDLLSAAGVVPVGTGVLRLTLFGLRQTCKGLSSRLIHWVKNAMSAWSIRGSRSA